MLNVRLCKVGDLKLVMDTFMSSIQPKGSLTITHGMFGYVQIGELERRGSVNNGDSLSILFILNNESKNKIYF